MPSAVPEISVVAVFHREGALAIPALASMAQMVSVARSKGLKIEALAVLDRADAITRELVIKGGNRLLDGLQEVDFGDLGLSRNAGVHACRGDYLTFLDGDDMWGADWLYLAFQAANEGTDRQAIWHPEYLYYFDETDFDCQSLSNTPQAVARSFVMKHKPSNSPDFDRRILFLNNVWTANVFASRQLYIQYPYSAVDRVRGFGVEDWAWNIATVWKDVVHLVVPDTVHLIRVKAGGSLGQQNTEQGLVPHLPPGVQI